MGYKIDVEAYVDESDERFGFAFDFSEDLTIEVFADVWFHRTSFGNNVLAEVPSHDKLSKGKIASILAPSISNYCAASLPCIPSSSSRPLPGRG